MGALLTVGVFSVILAVVPLWVFSQIRHGGLDWLISSAFGDYILQSKDSRVIFGGVAAIVLVNIVIFFFILVAFVFEPRVTGKKENNIPAGGSDAIIHDKKDE